MKNLLKSLNLQNAILLKYITQNNCSCNNVNDKLSHNPVYAIIKMQQKFQFILASLFWFRSQK